jgi:ribosomal protein S18 acetylase RimI-like enzyme
MTKVATQFAMGDQHRDESLFIDILRQGDEGELDAFLALHSHSSMYLRADLRRGTDRAVIAVARQQGRIVAAAAQVASGMILLQAPVGAGELVATVLRNSRRRLAGFFGPLAQVRAARYDMGLDEIPLLKDTHEDLFALDLADLGLPTILAEKKVTCRVAGEADFDHLVAWRAAFRQVALGDVEGEHLETMSRADIAALLPAGSLFILEALAQEDMPPEPLACCSFNARLPDVVQIGNVWTPPELRGNGYARAVVAGALAIAGNTGVVAAILSTGRKNVAAQAAYRSIGFKLVGDYAVATISPETALPDF